MIARINAKKLRSGFKTEQERQTTEPSIEDEKRKQAFDDLPWSPRNLLILTPNQTILDVHGREIIKRKIKPTNWI